MLRLCQERSGCVQLRALTVGLLGQDHELVVECTGFLTSQFGSTCSAIQALKRFGSLRCEASKAWSAGAGCFTSRSNSPRSSRAGTSGPGVTGCFSGIFKGDGMPHKFDCLVVFAGSARHPGGYHLALYLHLFGPVGLPVCD